nr:flagellar biosynthesis anti-sigma factor FlgM [Sedimentibacter sp.]
MKIQNINNYMSYNKSTKSTKSEEIVKAKNYDVIDIKKTSGNKDSKIENVKKSVVSQIETETKAEKIQKIKESIDNKTYKIDVDEIVNKLLK